MRYLIPVTRQRHHSVVSHILADDGQTALCVVSMNKRVRAWPRVSENDWMIADEPTDGYVCLRCRQANRKMESPPASKSPKKNNRAEQDLEKLARWNSMSDKTKSGRTK